MNPIRLRIVTAGVTRYLFTQNGRWVFVRAQGDTDALHLVTSEPVLLSFALEDHLTRCADPTTPAKILATVKAFCPRSRVNLLNKIDDPKPGPYDDVGNPDAPKVEAQPVPIPEGLLAGITVAGEA